MLAALLTARQLARRSSGAETVEPTHLLAGLLQQGADVAAALVPSGLTVEGLQVGDSHVGDSESAAAGPVPLSPVARAALRAAAEAPGGATAARVIRELLAAGGRQGAGLTATLAELGVDVEAAVRAAEDAG